MPTAGYVAKLKSRLVVVRPLPLTGSSAPGDSPQRASQAGIASFGEGFEQLHCTSAAFHVASGVWSLLVSWLPEPNDKRLPTFLLRGFTRNYFHQVWSEGAEELVIWMRAQQGANGLASEVTRGQRRPQG